MNPEIENLINMALADGEVTEKERAIILRKAEALGLDRDEVEMILDGKIAIQKKELSYSQSSKENTSNKAGDIKKCPSCGAPVQAFVIKCSDCGHEFSNIEANITIQKLFTMLDELESKRDDKVTTAGVIGGLFKNSIGGGALAQALGGFSPTDKRKREIIASFPVPNTKADILEFLSLAFPKAMSKGNFFTKNNPEYFEHNEYVSVWKSKFEQVIMKARFSMKDDRKTLDEIENYAKQLGI
jgi:hypothetical protein